MQQAGEQLLSLSQRLDRQGAPVAAYLVLMAALAQVETLADGDRVRAVSLPMLRRLQAVLATDADVRACWAMILDHLGRVETLQPPVVVAV